MIMGALLGLLMSNRARAAEIRRHNQLYEAYLDKEILGTELATLINRVMDFNTRNGVEQDETGHFISNETNSIHIVVEMITVEDTFTMESLARQRNGRICTNI